jgi:uncharacterized membrane protein YciS (DUF1049 family)
VFILGLDDSGGGFNQTAGQQPKAICDRAPSPECSCRGSHNNLHLLDLTVGSSNSHPSPFGQLPIATPKNPMLTLLSWPLTIVLPWLIYAYVTIYMRVSTRIIVLKNRVKRTTNICSICLYTNKCMNVIKELDEHMYLFIYKQVYECNKRKG